MYVQILVHNEYINTVFVNLFYADMNQKFDYISTFSQLDINALPIV